jgi:tRNA A22 N-methylase
MSRRMVIESINGNVVQLKKVVIEPLEIPIDLRSWVQAVLFCLRRPEAIVTSETQVKDLLVNYPEDDEVREEDERILGHLSREVGFVVNKNYRIIDVAIQFQRQQNFA